MDKTVEKTKEMKKSEKGSEIEVARPVTALSTFEEMDRVFDRWFENLMPSGWLRSRRSEWPSWGEIAAPFEARMPKVDVIDRDAEVIVKAEIPGVDKNDLDVSVADNIVTIKAESKQEKKEEKGDYYRCEISRGAFARTISLPHNVDATAAKAKFKDGVLELTLPKTEKTKRRSIKVD